MKLRLYKQILSQTVQPLLQTKGYELVIGSATTMEHPWWDNIGFVKSYKTINYSIDFQPSMLDEGIPNLDALTFNRFTVNLCRDYDIKADGTIVRRRVDQSPFRVRLASWLWIKDNYDPSWDSDHWYVFRNEAELVSVCLDACETLLIYGIPRLEDLSQNLENRRL